ncbi:ABC transporter substrate-binding protein [Jeongeupia chitinilytica]|uniref:Probable sugar-binding periplasmic protein n=1 Tax=Jeongeupia chitinilytica TaxID=1041641 RepID=A0ABQ3GVI5_9NEIS|nr:ABC transporter substrate-binding protein [Jeongeupia chitinilytica]GHD55402.1 sugar ABC transporter substrate-binding protein [Jeongeupia chitinilytica]
MRRFVLLAALVAAGVQAADIEVLHWWTSPGESRALQALRQHVNAAGYRWNDFGVIGGGGENALGVLRTRALSDNLPTAAAAGGAQVQEWARQDLLGDVSTVAHAQAWSTVLPPGLDAMTRIGNRYVAVPLGVARINMLWSNSAVLRRFKARPPQNWSEFFPLAEKLGRAGIVPLAVGQQNWQLATLFESIVLAEAGTDLYRQVFVTPVAGASGDPRFLRALTVFKRLKPYTNAQGPGREWNQVAADVIEGRAAMTVLGDWAKGEFSAAGKRAGRDYLCTAAPGTAAAFSVDADMLVLFRQSTAAQQQAQLDLARIAMSRETQEAFNFYKGNIPARTDVALDRYDECARLSARAFADSRRRNTLVPSWAHNMVLPDATRTAVFDVIGHFWRSPSMSAAQAARLIEAAIASADTPQHPAAPLERRG